TASRDQLDQAIAEVPNDGSEDSTDRIAALGNQRALVVQELVALEQRGPQSDGLTTFQSAREQADTIGLTPVSSNDSPISGVTDPTSLRTRLLLLCGIGLILAIGLVLVIERFDTRLRNKPQVEAAAQIPVLAEI